MNKISKYLFTGIMALSMAACADLDLNPLSEGASENWYHDETEIEMSLNDLWRPDFFPIDNLDWDDDLFEPQWIQRYHSRDSDCSVGYCFNPLDLTLQVHCTCHESNPIPGQRNGKRPK